jgi:NADP-dependent 3-hydroxy acid dehydrogenase YdfG
MYFLHSYSGIGRDLVKVLVKNGAVVYALSKNPENLKTLSDECPGVKPVVCDLSKWDETEKVLQEIEPVDHLVNNAGVAFRENFFDIQSDTFDQ